MDLFSGRQRNSCLCSYSYFVWSAGQSRLSCRMRESWKVPVKGTQSFLNAHQNLCCECVVFCLCKTSNVWSLFFLNSCQLNFRMILYSFAFREIGVFNDTLIFWGTEFRASLKILAWHQNGVQNREYRAIIPKTISEMKKAERVNS